MMRAIVLLHRWLGIAFCLVFAMWFATGIVMHFVPFPSLTEAERFAGLLGRWRVLGRGLQSPMPLPRAASRMRRAFA